MLELRGLPIFLYRKKENEPKVSNPLFSLLSCADDQQERISLVNRRPQPKLVRKITLNGCLFNRFRFSSNSTRWN